MVTIRHRGCRGVSCVGLQTQPPSVPGGMPGRDCHAGHWECVWSREDLPGCLSGGPSRAPSSDPDTRRPPSIGVSPAVSLALQVQPHLHTVGWAGTSSGCVVSAAGFQGALCVSGIRLLSLPWRADTVPPLPLVRTVLQSRQQNRGPHADRVVSSSYGSALVLAVSSASCRP